MPMPPAQPQGPDPHDRLHDRQREREREQEIRRTKTRLRDERRERRERRERERRCEMCGVPTPSGASLCLQCKQSIDPRQPNP